VISNGLIPLETPDRHTDRSGVYLMIRRLRLRLASAFILPLTRKILAVDSAGEADPSIKASTALSIMCVQQRAESGRSDATSGHAPRTEKTSLAPRQTSD